MASHPESAPKTGAKKPVSSVTPRDLPPKAEDRVRGGLRGGDDDLNDLEVERLKRR